MSSTSNESIARSVALFKKDFDNFYNRHVEKEVSNSCFSSAVSLLCLRFEIFTACQCCSQLLMTFIRSLITKRFELSNRLLVSSFEERKRFYLLSKQISLFYVTASLGLCILNCSGVSTINESNSLAQLFFFFSSTCQSFDIKLVVQFMKALLCAKKNKKQRNILHFICTKVHNWKRSMLNFCQYSLFQVHQYTISILGVDTRSKCEHYILLYFECGFQCTFE